MVERFFPDKIIDSVQNLDLDELAGKKIKGIILDIDNTLVRSYTPEPDEGAIKWIQLLKDRGFMVSLVSNNTKGRVRKFNEKLKVYAVHEAVKPRRAGFLKAAELMGIKPYEIAVIGDQLFTDIYGGNRLNMYTILVSPISIHEFPFVKFKRLFEKAVMRKYREESTGLEPKRLDWKKKSAIEKTKGNGNEKNKGEW